MGGITRQIIGEINPNLKGEAYVNELNKKLSPEAIAKAEPKEQKVENC